MCQRNSWIPPSELERIVPSEQLVYKPDIFMIYFLFDSISNIYYYLWHGVRGAAEDPGYGRVEARGIDDCSHGCCS